MRPSWRRCPSHSQLRPISVAYTMAGFSGDTAACVQPRARRTGPRRPRRPDAGLAAGTAVAAALAPGDAVGVSLIRGDLTFGATGTVTHVDGTQVYAFGHPFFNLGPTEFPMTRACVQTLLPSLNVSQKLAAIGDVVGTVRQDRSTAIAGTLGAGPALVPVTLTLQSDRAPARTFRFEIVKDQLFTPLLTFASIANTLQAYEREFGVATFLVRGTAQVRGHGAVAIDDVFSGDSPAIGAAASVSGPLSLLLRNERQPVQIDGVELAIQSFEEPRTASIERVWLGAREPRAGETVPVHVVTRSYRGEERTHTIPIRIPAGSSGALSLIVSDGTRLAFSERSEQRPPVDERQRAAADSRLQRVAAQQPHLRQADAGHVRRHRRRRARAVAAAVGPGRDRRRAARRRRPAALVGRRRRMGRARPTRPSPASGRCRSWSARTRNPWWKCRCIRRTMHPAWRRCSSVEYSRYSPSSRLASRAPRPSRCDAALPPRAPNPMPISGIRRRPRPWSLGCALAALALAGATALQAASTGFWVVATQADFLKGDTDAVSIDTDGRVTIAPALQLLGDVGTPAVWRIAAARGQVWAATGHDGKLWRFPATGDAKGALRRRRARPAGDRGRAARIGAGRLVARRQGLSRRR